MLTVKINGKEYEVVNGWGDLTLGQYVAYCKNALAKTPQCLTDYYNAKTAQDKKAAADAITEQVYDAQVLPHFCRVIAALSNIPFNTLLDCDKESVESLHRVIITSLKTPQETPRKYAEINGKRYKYPERFMAKSTVGEFVDAAQFEKMILDNNGNEFEAMPRVAACLLKLDGEVFTGEYSEEFLAARSKEMEQMPMTEAWQLFFFIEKRKNIYTMVTQIALTSQAGQNYKQGSQS